MTFCMSSAHFSLRRRRCQTLEANPSLFQGRKLVRSGYIGSVDVHTVLVPVEVTDQDHAATVGCGATQYEAGVWQKACKQDTCRLTRESKLPSQYTTTKVDTLTVLYNNLGKPRWLCVSPTSHV